MLGKLSGKTALVTGASSGIGEATALQLAAEGALVAIAARRADRLEALAARIETLGGKALPLVGDVCIEEDARRMVEALTASAGRIDILVNNAGVMLLGPILHADTEDWRRMVNTNVLGLLYCTHAALPHMAEAKSGHIVNISSVAGRTARAGAAVYNATKWGVGAFSEALRQEALAHKIRVTIIEPGLVATELRDHITHQESKQSINAWAESLTQLTSEDIAASVVYAVTQPWHVNVNEILIRPTEQLG